MAETIGPNGPAAIIIDDQRALAELLAERLSLDGFDTTVATTAAEGFTLFDSRSYRVAFVDLKLPDTSGIAVAAELKRRSPDIKVILITGFATSVDDTEPGWTHIDGVLPKPWRPNELETILHTVGRVQR